jgi:hypothetical protein
MRTPICWHCAYENALKICRHHKSIMLHWCSWIVFVIGPWLVPSKYLTDAAGLCSVNVALTCGDLLISALFFFIWRHIAHVREDVLILVWHARPDISTTGCSFSCRHCQTCFPFVDLFIFFHLFSYSQTD